jgi:hypothetical protein
MAARRRRGGQRERVSGPGQIAFVLPGPAKVGAEHGKSRDHAARLQEMPATYSRRIDRVAARFDDPEQAGESGSANYSSHDRRDHVRRMVTLRRRRAVNPDRTKYGDACDTKGGAARSQQADENREQTRLR